MLSNEVLGKSGYLVIDEDHKELIDNYNNMILDTTGKPIKVVTNQDLNSIVSFNNKADSISAARREQRREKRLAREAKKLDRKQKRNNRSHQKLGGN